MSKQQEINKEETTTKNNSLSSSQSQKITLDELITPERFKQIEKRVFQTAIKYPTLTLNQIVNTNGLRIGGNQGIRFKQKRDSTGQFNTDIDAFIMLVNNIIEKHKQGNYKNYSDITNDLAEIYDNNSLNLMSTSIKEFPVHFPLRDLQNLIYNQEIPYDHDTKLLYEFFTAISKNHVRKRISKMKKISVYDSITEENKEFLLMDLQLHSKNIDNHVLPPIQLDDFGSEYLYNFTPEFSRNEYNVQYVTGLKREGGETIYLIEFSQEKVLRIIKDFNNDVSESISYHVVGSHTQQTTFEDFLQMSVSEISKMQTAKKYANMKIR